MSTTAATPPASSPARSVPPSGSVPPATSWGLAVRLLVVAGLVVAEVNDVFLKAIERVLGTLDIGTLPDNFKGVASFTVLFFLVVAVWPRLFLDKRYQAPVLITCILLLANRQYGILENHAAPLLSALTDGRVTSYSPTFVTIATAILTELALGWIVYGKWPNPASAYVSGISAGILIKSPELWPFVLCAMISIVSKYTLRVGGRHIWNPTNFGISCMLFLAPQSVASLSVQSGNEVWANLVVWTLGALILYRIGKLHIPLAFAAAYVPLAFVRSALTGDPWQTELAPITGPVYQLFMCFMITDPKTTTHRRWSQSLVAVLVAVAETFFRLNRVVHAPYYALFVVGPIANLIEIAWDARHRRPVAASATA